MKVEFRFLRLPPIIFSGLFRGWIIDTLHGKSRGGSGGDGIVGQQRRAL